jgi:peptidoglycan/xylan/chitin deacetylase (PgdA/CDA1 family)
MLHIRSSRLRLWCRLLGLAGAVPLAVAVAGLLAATAPGRQPLAVAGSPHHHVHRPRRPAAPRSRLPIGCVRKGPAMVFAGSSRAHELALTFDDGPWGDPPTADFIRLLAAEHVPATFFEIGNQISRYDPAGRLEREMLADGDMIGDHTWAHPDLLYLTASARREQIARTAAAIRRVTGFTPCLFRAPYGAVNRSLVTLVRSMGMSTIGWDVDPRDWALPGVAAIERAVIGGARNGSIILQHFGGGPRWETLDALPVEIRALRARGYRFVTVTQLLGYRLIYPRVRRGVKKPGS